MAVVGFGKERGEAEVGTRGSEAGGYCKGSRRYEQAVARPAGRGRSVPRLEARKQGGWLDAKFMDQQRVALNLSEQVPHGLVVRIHGFHPCGQGSIYIRTSK